MGTGWFDLPVDEYLGNRWRWIQARAEENPILGQMLQYEGSYDFLRSNWTRQYYEHKIAELQKGE